MRPARCGLARLTLFNPPGLGPGSDAPELATTPDEAGNEREYSDD
jgi:hypothetical protein